MTMREARVEAHRRWGTTSSAPGDRYGVTSRGRKSPLYRVGFCIRAGRGLDGTLYGAMVWMGESDASWDAAFTTWLLKAAEFAKARPDSVPVQHDRDAEGWQERKQAALAHEASEREKLNQAAKVRNGSPPIANERAGPLAGAIARVVGSVQ